MYPRHALRRPFLEERVRVFCCVIADMNAAAILAAIALVVLCLSSSSSVVLNYGSKHRNPPPAATTAAPAPPAPAPPPPADEATSAPTKAPKVIKAAKPGDIVAKGGGASTKKTAAPTTAPAPPAGGGKVIAERARTTFYNPENNTPSGSRACAYRNPCTSPDQGSPSSAAHARSGGSPYTKGGLYTIEGPGKPPFCVRIDDTCDACKGTHIDIFLEDGKKLPYDYAKVTEGC